MEQQRIALRVQGLSVIIDTSHLSRGNKHQSSFLVVILIAPVINGAVYFLFQEDGIETETFATVLQNLHLGKIDYAHQGVQCFQSQKLIIVVDCLQV